jgi:hypothetical protein
MPSRKQSRGKSKKKHSRVRSSSDVRKRPATLTIEIQAFSSKTLTDNIARQILTSNFCMRDDKHAVDLGWLEFQLSRAPIILVAEVNGHLGGFLLGFTRNKDKASDKKTWTLDTVCRKPGDNFKSVVSLLIDRFSTFAKKHRMRAINLYATTDFSRTAYEKYGFVATSKKDEYGGTSMQLVL